MHVHKDHRSQKGVSDSLELELQRIVSGHVGDGNQTWVVSTTEPPFQPLTYTFKVNNFN